MINFIIPNTSHYKEILMSFINPISRRIDFDEWGISNKSVDNCVNFHFFNEPEYIREVGTRGKSVFVSHGIADKNWRNINRVNIFDYVVVSGPAWRDKMLSQGMDAFKIIIGGYPKFDDIVFEKQPVKNNKRVVLWCPTHNVKNDINSNFRISSYPFFTKEIKKIPPSEFKFKISEHPANRADKKPTLQQIYEADTIISDSGSMVYEAWILGKPVVFPDWIVKNSILSYYPNSFEEKIYKEGIGYHCINVVDLVSKLRLDIDEKAKDFIETILPKELIGNSSDVLLLELKRRLYA